MYSSRDKVVTFPTEVILSILEFVYFRDGIFDIETTKSCALVGFPWRKGSYYPDLGSSRHDFIRCLSLLSAERRQYVSHITRIVRIAPLLSANSRDLIDVIAALPSLEKLTVDLARSPIIESDDFTPLHKLSSLNLQSFALISSFHPSANPSLFVSLCGSWSLLERLTLSQLSMEPDWIPPDLPPFSLSELRFYMPFWLFGNANLLFAWILSNTPPSKLTMLAFADLPPSSLLTPVLDFRGRYIQSFEVGRSFGRMDGSAEKLLISVLNKCPGLRDVHFGPNLSATLLNEIPQDILHICFYTNPPRFGQLHNQAHHRCHSPIS
jgi:hypothetical protein